MGQPVTVIEKPSQRPDVVRYETNRTLSGMGHDRFTDPATITGDRPVDELGRRLLATGGIQAVHVNGNIITVTLTPGGSSAGVKEIIEGLYTYYRPGVPVPSFEAPEPAGDAPAADAPADGGA
jgi:hypothetical protein